MNNAPRRHNTTPLISMSLRLWSFAFSALINHALTTSCAERVASGSGGKESQRDESFLASDSPARKWEGWAFLLETAISAKTSGSI